MYCVEDMYFTKYSQIDRQRGYNTQLVHYSNANSIRQQQQQQRWLMCLLQSNLFPPFFVLLSKGSIPQFLDEEAVAAFNASMHSEYGYSKSSLDKPFTETDFKHLVDFHNYLDDRCKWMIKRWIDLLEPLQTGRYRQMYTTYNYSQIERCIQH